MLGIGLGPNIFRRLIIPHKTFHDHRHPGRRRRQSSVFFFFFAVPRLEVHVNSLSISRVIDFSIYYNP